MNETLSSLFDDQQWQALNAALSGARECFERDGHCLEVVLTPEVATVVGVAGWNRKLIDDLIAQLSKEGFTIHIAEAWMTHPRRVPESGEYLRPRDDPERREYVGVRVFDKEGKRTVFIRAEITRSPGEKPTLGKWEVLGDTDQGCTAERIRHRSTDHET